MKRGWKTVRSVLAEGNRMQYNFVKPHMALDGQTPAQAAGIKTRGWNELLKLAITNQARTTNEEQPGTEHYQ